MAEKFSAAEREVIKNGFKDETVLTAIRNHFYQFELTEGDKTILNNLKPDEKAIIKKFFLPTPTAENPLGVPQTDSYFSLVNIGEIPPDVAYTHILAQDIVTQYLQQQFDSLTEAKEQPLNLKGFKLTGNKDSTARFVTMLAYLKLTNALIDNSLNGIRYLAQNPDETEKEMREKAKLNSAK